MTGWIVTAYHFISSVVQCGVEHSSEIGQVTIDMVKCITAKFFQV